MKKLNSVIYNKLMIQAQEAQSQGIIKLADNIYSAIGAHPEEEIIKYSYDQLNDDIEKEMWKMATHIIKYHGLESVNAEKLDNLINIFAEQFISELESSFEVDNVITGPFEELVPGESK